MQSRDANGPVIRTGHLPHSFATKRLQKAKEEKELSNHHQLLIFFALNPGLHRELGKKIVLFCSAE